jgi:hypothetical protein
MSHPLLRGIAVLTGAIWLQLFVGAVSMYRSIHSVTNAALIILTCLIACVALISAFRPKRAAALAMLIASLVLAVGDVCTFWSWSGNRAAFFDVRNASDAVEDMFQVFYVLLPFIWAALYWRLSHEAVR